jgi:protein phosphatase PTC7
MVDLAQKTDGLGDNVHPGEMIGLAALMGRQTASKRDQNLAQILADGLVEYAIVCMHSQEKVSPFERGFHHCLTEAQLK